MLPAGKTLGIMGESGSGKSTLALAVLGLLPFKASCSWSAPAGRRQSQQPALRRQVQVVFQDPFSSLSPRLTVEEIVGEGLGVHELRPVRHGATPTREAGAWRGRVGLWGRRGSGRVAGALPT